MASIKPEKTAVVEELTAIASESVSAIAADYRGLTVSQMTELRVNARKNGVHMRVYKNTLASLALKETEFSSLGDSLKGPMVLFFSKDDPGAAARLLREFIKKHEKFKVSALAVGGQLLGADRLGAIASLPTREEALARLASVLQAPIVKFVRTLREPYAQAVRVFAAVQSKKQ